MGTYEKLPLSHAPKEQLGIADTAVDRELTSLEEEETLACLEMVSTQDPLRKLFSPSDPLPANPSPVLPGLPSPSTHAYEKGVADVSVDSPSYPKAPPPTPQADSDCVAKPGNHASRNNAEKAMASAALKTVQGARRLAEKVKLIDYTLNAIQMRMENDRMLSGLLPRLSRDVAERALTKFYKSRSEDYRGTLAGHSAVEDVLASEARQLHDAVNRDRISGALPSPCGEDLVQRMEDIEIESSRERQRELGIIDCELVEVDRDMASGVDKNMSESSLKQLSHTRERYTQLWRLHVENQRHKEQQLKEQRLREQQLMEQQQRVQQLEEQHVRDQQFHAHPLKGHRMQSDDPLEQSFRSMNLQEPRQGEFQERELARRMSVGDRPAHAHKGDSRSLGVLENGARMAAFEGGAGTYPVSREPIVSSGHNADPASNFARPGTSAGHFVRGGSSVLQPGAVMAQQVPRSSADRMTANAPRQMPSNLAFYQQYPDVDNDRRSYQSPPGGVLSNDIPYLDIAKASQLPQGPQPPLVHVAPPVPQDYSFQASRSHRAHVPESNPVVGAYQRYYSAQESVALAVELRNPPHQRPPKEYAIGRPHSLSINPVSQTPHDHFSPLMQQPQSVRYKTAQEERLDLDRHRDSFHYAADKYQPQDAFDGSGYPVGTYYEEAQFPYTHPSYSEQMRLPPVSSQQTAGAMDPRFNPLSHPVAPLASNQGPPQPYASNQGPPQPYGASRIGSASVAGPSESASYIPTHGQPQTSMYPVSRELQSRNHETENYILGAPRNQPSEIEQISVHRTDGSALAAPGLQPVRSRSALSTGEPSANLSQGEESLAIYRQVQRGPNQYVEGTVKVQRLGNPEGRPEMERQDESSYQEYLHIVKGKAQAPGEGHNVHAGLVNGGQQYASDPERHSSNIIRRARSSLPFEPINSGLGKLRPQVSDLSSFGVLPQVQRVSAGVGDAPQLTSGLVREGLVANLSMPQRPMSHEQEGNSRGEMRPSSNQQTLQSMVNAFANV